MEEGGVRGGGGRVRRGGGGPEGAGGNTNRRGKIKVWGVECGLGEVNLHVQMHMLGGKESVGGQPSLG